MRVLDRLFIRRRLPRFGDIPDRARGRLDTACRDLAEAEDRMAERLGLADAPRLLLVDEEEAVVVEPAQRGTIAAVAQRRKP